LEEALDLSSDRILNDDYTFLIVRISASLSDWPLLIEDVESKFGLLLSSNTLSMSVLESFDFWFQNFLCVAGFMLIKIHKVNHNLNCPYP